MQLFASTKIKQKQGLAITVQLQQAIKLLHYNNTELASYLEEQAQENPFIELAPAKDEKPTIDSLSPSRADKRDEKVTIDNQFETGDSFSSGNSKASRNFNDDVGFGDTLKSTGPSLYEHACQFAHSNFTNDKELRVALALCEELEPSGWLTVNLQNIKQRISVSDETIERVLSTMQTIEPSGLFARNLRECLILQLEDLDLIEDDILNIIEWLEDVCAGDSLVDGLGAEMACGYLELIADCFEGDSAACAELEMALDIDWDWEEEDVDEEDDEEEDDDEEDDDEEEEETEDECEVEFEFEQALDEDGVPLPYNIVAYVEEPGADTYYFWTFGDGNESDEPNPTHVYEEVGNYEVCLTVTQMLGDSLACMATYCDTLMIDMDGLVCQQLVLNILFPGQTVNAVAEQDVVLDVFPNPAADVVRIHAEAGIQSAIVRTMDGRWVGRWQANGTPRMVLSCATWPVGIYVLEVRTAAGVQRSTVLVQR